MTAVVSTLVVGLLVFAGPAAAAGSFTWSASVSQALYSRQWTQGAGSVSITSKLSCGGKTGKIYYIALQRKSGATWVDYTRRAYLCGWSETNSWSGTSAGTYRFVITTTPEGVTLVGSGTTRYP